MKKDQYLKNDENNKTIFFNVTQNITIENF